MSARASAIRIAHVTPSLSRLAGGPFVSVRRLSQCLAAEGADIEVFGIEDACTGEDLPLWAPLRPVAFPRSFLAAFGYARGLGGALAESRADLIHSHGIWMYPSLAALRWSEQAGKPRIVAPRGMLEPWAWKHHWWKKRPLWWAWERRNARTAAALHATAPEEADNLRNLGLRNPIAVLPNGVDLPHRLAAHAATGERTALFVSRIHPKKGLLHLVQAWGKLRPSGWRMVVAGPSEGGHEEEVKAAVQAAGLADQFEFPGPVYDEAKWEAYRQADLFVLPTFSENFGIVVAEAMASGIPVITTKGTPWREVEERRCGWWVDIGAEPLARALGEAMALPDGERRKMGLRGQKLVEERYSWPKIAADMLSVYQWVLGQGERPDCVQVQG